MRQRIRIIRTYIFVFPFLLYLKLFSKKNHKYFFFVKTIGDTCYGLSYYKYAIEKYQCTFFFTKNNATLIKDCYPDLCEKANVIFLNRNSFWGKQLAYAILNTKMFWHFINSGIRSVFPYSYYNNSQLIGKTYFDFLKEIPYDFVENGAICYPAVKHNKVTSIVGFENIKDKIVVINTHSSSLEGQSVLLWERMVDILIQNGYIVYSNVIKEQKEIKNTKRLECSIYELYNICMNIPLLVSIRSGILDFTIATTCKKYAIWFNYDDEANEMMKILCDLHKWSKSNVHQVYYSHDNNVIDDFLKFIKEMS